MVWKYEKEFELSQGSRKRFLELCRKAYPNVKQDTMRRQFYDLRIMYRLKSKKEIQPNNNGVVTTDDDADASYFMDDNKIMKKPDGFKMLMFQDMVRYKCADKKTLLKYGFTDDEIQWLIHEGLLNE